MTSKPIQSGISVTLVFAPAPRAWIEETVCVPKGTSLAGALVASGWKERFQLAQNPDAAFGIWGRAADLGTVLREGDRVEVVRQLRVDPKVARRERFRKQGSKAAGLFSQRRPGSKAGY